MNDIACDQCGGDATLHELMENEGYCEVCCRENQRELDSHNISVDTWQCMTDGQREDAIRSAC